MRKETIKDLCVTCKYRMRLNSISKERQFAETGRWKEFMRCFGYNTKTGLLLPSMKEDICPKIKDAKEYLRLQSIAIKEEQIKVCDTNISRLLERKTKLEKELELLKK